MAVGYCLSGSTWTDPGKKYEKGQTYSLSLKVQNIFAADTF